MKSLIVIGLIAASSLWALAANKPAPSAAVVGKQAETAVAVRAKTQKMADAFAAKKAELLDRIDALQKELDTVTAQRKKTEIYLAGQRAKVAQLQQRLAEIARLKTELEPLLDKSLERLDDFVGQDLPFLAQERRARLDSLVRALSDYDQGLGPKTRRMLEALVVETRYGHSVEVTEGEIKAEGGTLRVRLIRLGRLALFALSADGRRAWRLDADAERFELLDGPERALSALADIAERKRVVSLVDVPLGKKPQKAVAK